VGCSFVGKNVFGVGNGVYGVYGVYGFYRFNGFSGFSGKGGGFAAFFWGDARRPEGKSQKSDV